MDNSFRKPIVLLFDEYSKDSKSLHTSFKMAKSNCEVVVINDDGFLPDGVISVYDSFLGDFTEYDTYLGKARYFNQIVIPEYWEIDASTSGGKVHDLNKDRAKIYFAETNNNKRRVKVVEWYDDNGKVRLSDHYNKYGVLYARTAFNAKGERVNKVYYSSNHREVIYENYVTGAILLNEDGKERIFSSKIDFVVYFMNIKGYDEYRVYYNTLWYSFFVSERMKAGVKDDILFWQENPREDIPGNMQIILGDKAQRTQLIMVQKRESYNKLIEHGASPAILRTKGFIYPFERENNGSSNVLIATNSDQIEHLEDLVKSLPEVTFHVAALTTMSDKLMSMETYENVRLYPGIKDYILDDLFRECDIYLDINRYDEICDAVYRAFLNNQVIMAFKSTVHNAAFEADEAIYEIEDWEKISNAIREMLTDRSLIERRIEAQHNKALAESVSSYSLLV